MDIQTKIFEWVIFDSVILLILLSGYPRVYSGKRLYLSGRQSDLRNVFMCVMIMALAIFGYADWDFYGYSTRFYDYKLFNKEVHLERIYFYIADLSPNYLLWRGFVWGSAAILMAVTIRRLKLNVLTTWVFIGLFYAIHFFKLRNALGFSIAFYGLSLITSPINHYNLFSKFIGLIIISVSYFFHDSMPITIGIIILSFFKLNKKLIIISFIAWPFLVSAVTILLNLVITGGIGDLSSSNGGFDDKALRYGSASHSESNLNGIMRLVLDYSAIYLPLIYFAIRVFVKKNIVLPKSIITFFNYWYISFYVASLFLLQNTSNWIFIRIYTMGLFPMCVVLGYIYANVKRTNMMRTIMTLALISCLFGIFYGIYKA